MVERYSIGVDIGGTFTDLVMFDEVTGRLYNEKVLTTPKDPSVGVLEGIERILAANGASAAEVCHVIHGTTLVANAVIERRGSRIALVATRGFADLIEIGTEWRYDIYDLSMQVPEPLVPRRLRFEVAERLGPDGAVLQALDENEAVAVAHRIAQSGVAAVAICLLHSFRNPQHERRLREILRREAPDVVVCISSDVMPEIGEYERTSTTVCNAYVLPVFEKYLKRLTEGLRGHGVTKDLYLMLSDGGTVHESTAAAYPVRLVQSGPAGGVQAIIAIGAAAGERNLLCFDMGGTTAKAGLVENGEVLRTEAMEVGGGVMAGSRLLVGAGYMLKLPAIDLAEVGAGGGSICRLDAGGAPKVGPDSAGASPGPVCYGRGGTQPTITDCNLALGYLDPAGLVGGALKLDIEAARAAIARDLAGPMGVSIEQAAHGMLRLAAATMMRAIRAVSVERGRDPRDFSLLAFGGNGALFAAGIAAELGIRRVIVPPLPGVFSAFGLLVADTEHHATQSLRMRLDRADADRIGSVLAALRAAGHERLVRDGFPPDRHLSRASALARYLGQSSEIAVPLPDGPVTPAVIAEAFGQEHERTYGFRAPAEEPVELMGLSVMARGLPEKPRLPGRIPPASAPVPAERQAWFPASGWVATPVVDRAGLGASPRPGPLLVQEYDATCLVPAGMTAAVDDFGAIRLAAG